jgi:hypothetical protein
VTVIYPRKSPARLNCKCPFPGDRARDALDGTSHRSVWLCVCARARAPLLSTLHCSATVLHGSHECNEVYVHRAYCMHTCHTFCLHHTHRTQAQRVCYNTRGTKRTPRGTKHAAQSHPAAQSPPWLATALLSKTNSTPSTTEMTSLTLAIHQMQILSISIQFWSRRDNSVVPLA